MPQKIWELREKIAKTQEKIALERYRKTRLPFYLEEANYWQDVGQIAASYSVRRSLKRA
jgi:hypothetical protein